jgi:hypothetical protein
LRVIGLVLLCAACSSGSVPPTADGGGSTILLGHDLLARLGALWSGPVSQTPLGDFPLMAFDFRPADPHVLFGRVDLDSANALRFAFSIETFGGKDALVFRNGGLFNGLSRDTRTVLYEQGSAPPSWRFCDESGACDYVDARFRFDAEDRMILDVKVRGQQHVYWDARRLETRALPSPFPVDDTSQGTGNAPFPPMPRLEATVSWGAPLAADADVWLLLSVSDCSLASGCAVSRFLRTAAAAGSTSASSAFEQIHAGSYKGNAILDRNRNWASTLRPDSGDGVSLPNQAVTIAASGTSTASLTVVYDLP